MAPPAYQLKIVLNGIKPPVWRRVVVSGDSTISFLHEVVQAAMGWYNCHLHQFLIRGKEYGVSYEGGVHFADDPGKGSGKDAGSCRARHKPGWTKPLSGICRRLKAL